MKLNTLLTIILIVLILPLLLRAFMQMWPLLLLLGLGFYLYKKLPKPEKKAFTHGQIYRQCSYCKKRAERTAISCDFCGRALE